MSYELDAVELVHARNMARHPFHAKWEDYNHYSFLLALEGDLYHQMDNGERRRLSPPFMFWNHPDHIYHYGPIKGKWTHIYAAFTGERAKWIMEQGLMPLYANSYVELKDATYFESCFRRIVQAFVDNEEDASQAGILLIESMYLELRKSTKHSPVQNADSAQVILQTAKLIRDAPLNTFNFPKWASNQGMSYSNFRLLFRKTLNSSPQQYLMKHRFNWARKRVTDTDLSLQEIGAAIGYQNPSVFSRAFKQYYGISAKEVRRSFNAKQ